MSQTRLLPDLTISKTPTTSSVLIGDTVSYTVRVSNVGRSIATGFQIQEVLPAGVQFVSGAGMCRCGAIACMHAACMSCIC